MTVTVSPRSTASSRSEKCRDASVAVMVRMPVKVSDNQIFSQARRAARSLGDTVAIRRTFRVRLFDVFETDGTEPPEIDVSVAHPARMYDYYLGGQAHFAADREAAERVLAVLPEGRQMA